MESEREEDIQLSLEGTLASYKKLVLSPCVRTHERSPARLPFTQSPNT